MPTDLPSPYDFLDHRVFLVAWFDARKRANPRFSHRAFARLAGQKSPSLLLHVMEGRRNLTPTTTEAFAEAMGLRAGEAQFFRLLVALDQAPDADARNAVWDQLAATRRFREARRADLASFDYLSNWTFPAVRELARRSDFRDDPEWVAAQLRPEVAVGEAAKALDGLVALGMLVRRDGKLTPAEVSLSTPTEVAGLAVRNHHRGMIGLASESIDRFPSAERHLLAVTVGVPESLMPTLKAESNAFLERMMHLCDASTSDPDRIVQMNLQIFPLTAARGTSS